MDLLVNGQRFPNTTPLRSGGEGEIHTLDAASVAKVYWESIRQDTSWQERRQKVLALCNSYQNNSARHGTMSIAFPQHPAHERVVAFDSLVGFSMRWFDSCPPIGALGFDLTVGKYKSDAGITLGDDTAIGFVYDTFRLIDQLHQARIILGDVNDGNLLYNPTTRQPLLVDIDSAQIGSFGCPATTEAYNDPAILLRGKTLSGCPCYDEGTDIFSFGILCFEFVVGVRPHFLYVTPPQTDLENKRAGISNIGCLELGPAFLAGTGKQYVDCTANRMIQQRLSLLKSKDRRLYEFFVSLFVRNERENLLFSLPISDARHPGNQFLVGSGFKKVIDEEVRRRSVAQAQSPKVGAVASAGLPDSGFRRVIDALAGKTHTVATPAAASGATGVGAAPKRQDPAGLRLFVEHFGLKV